MVTAMIITSIAMLAGIVWLAMERDAWRSRYDDAADEHEAILRRRDADHDRALREAQKEAKVYRTARDGYRERAAQLEDEKARLVNAKAVRVDLHMHPDRQVEVFRDDTMMSTDLRVRLTGAAAIQPTDRIDLRDMYAATRLDDDTLARSKDARKLVEIISDQMAESLWDHLLRHGHVMEP